MEAVRRHGTPLVEHADRIGAVEPLGIDETSYQSAQADPSDDLRHGPCRPRPPHRDRHGEGNPAEDPRTWCPSQPEWLGSIEIVATDLTEHHRSGMSPSSEMTARH